MRAGGEPASTASSFGGLAIIGSPSLATGGRVCGGEEVGGGEGVADCLGRWQPLRSSARAAIVGTARAGVKRMRTQPVIADELLRRLIPIIRRPQPDSFSKSKQKPEA